MKQIKAGFENTPTTSAAEQLRVYGPTILVDVGFDPNFDSTNCTGRPAAGAQGVRALIDTGASHVSIDQELAQKLSLPVVEREMIFGISGLIEVDVHIVQIFVPTLNGTFVTRCFSVAVSQAFAVDSTIDGESITHQLILGRDFLASFLLSYDGRSGAASLFHRVQA